MREEIKMMVEEDSNHPITGFVIYASDNDRTIASFWHEHEAIEFARRFNNHDRLSQENQRLTEALDGLYEAFYSEYSSGALTYNQDVEMANTLELLTELKGGEDD